MKNNKNENKKKQTSKKLNNEGLGKVSGGANPAFETNFKIDPNIPPRATYNFPGLGDKFCTDQKINMHCNNYFNFSGSSNSNENKNKSTNDKRD